MNDILTEREECAKIVDKMPLRKIGSVLDYAGVIRETAAAIRARPAPEPVVTDEMVERACVAAASKTISKYPMGSERNDTRFREVIRAALVAALGGK